jgi:hypothetical protein
MKIKRRSLNEKLEILEYWKQVKDIQLVLDVYFEEVDGKQRETMRKNLYYWRKTQQRKNNEDKEIIHHLQSELLDEQLRKHE